MDSELEIKEKIKELLDLKDRMEARLLELTNEYNELRNKNDITREEQQRIN